MAKKLIKLSAVDIILQADAETIREAYESRVKIDDLLVKREEAYRQIEAVEQQIETLVGEEGAFVYPAPPLPVAGFSKLAPAARPVKPKPASKPASKPDEALKTPAANDADKEKDGVASTADPEASEAEKDN